MEQPTKVKKCPEFGHVNKLDADYCTKCGAPLPADTITEIQQSKIEDSAAPLPYESSTKPATKFQNVNFDFNTPGYYLDGWADVIVDKGDKAKAIQEAFDHILVQRKMPKIKIGKLTQRMSGDSRTFTVTNLHPGAATIIYIDKHGQDLYISWKTFIKPILDTMILLAVPGISAVLSGLVAYPLRSIPSFIVGFMLFSLLAIALVAVAGRLIKGSGIAYFLIEPNIFDTDNIIAMSLSVHKSIEIALEQEGIDKKALRLKIDFKVRQGEII